MIFEALNYAASWPFTPAEFRHRLPSSVSLWSRANRCAAEWKTHEDNCRQVMAEAAGALSSRRTCVILGSGLLRDVPFRTLSSLFDTVVLVDLVHLASTRLGVTGSGCRNIRYIHRDLSGWQAVRQGETSEPLAFLRQVPYLDFVISANLLSQIGIGAARQLERDEPAMEEEQRTELLRRVIEVHVEGLAGLSCPALMVTDTGFDIVDREGVTVDRADLVHGARLPDALREWPWTVAPRGEASRRYTLRHRVMTHLFNAPRRTAP